MSEDHFDDEQEGQGGGGGSRHPMAARFRGYLPVVVDVETGGFNSATDALLEIAATTIAMDEKGFVYPDHTYFFRVEPFEGALVKIQQSADSPLICTGSQFAEQCTAPLAFTTEGFDEPSSLLAAVSETEAGPWTLAAVEVTESVEGGPRTVSIAVPGDTGDREPSQLIAAVLVYDGSPPENLPLVSAQLADFGVDLVYISQRLVIVVPR